MGFGEGDVSISMLCSSRQPAESQLSNVNRTWSKGLNKLTSMCYTLLFHSWQWSVLQAYSTAFICNQFFDSTATKWTFPKAVTCFSLISSQVTHFEVRKSWPSPCFTSMHFLFLHFIGTSHSHPLFHKHHTSTNCSCILYFTVLGVHYKACSSQQGYRLLHHIVYTELSAFNPASFLHLLILRIFEGHYMHETIILCNSLLKQSHTLVWL